MQINLQSKKNSLRYSFAWEWFGEFFSGNDIVDVIEKIAAVIRDEWKYISQTFSWKN